MSLFLIILTGPKIIMWVLLRVPDVLVIIEVKESQFLGIENMFLKKLI